MQERLAVVRVWDLPTRVFHWLLAALVIASIVSAKIGGNAMPWHFRFGYVIFTLLLFRAVWGLIGGRWSRFASFVYAPATTLRYLRGRSQVADFHDVGHSPLGALSVLALLALLAAQIATGLFADDEISNTGPLIKFVSGATSAAFTSWHKTYGQRLIIGLSILHVAAVVFYLVRRKNNLVRPMWTGDKLLPPDVPAARDQAGSRAVALAVAAACAALVAWLVNLGG